MLNLTVERKALERALVVAAAAADPKSTMPVLSHALLRASGQELVVQATDAVLSASASVAAVAGKGEGALCVPAKPLLDLVRNFSTEEVRLHQKREGELLLEAGGKYRLRCLPEGDFPRLPEVPADGAGWRVVPAAELARLISRVRHAVGQDIARPNLNGAEIKLGAAGVVGLSSTDGHRGAHAEWAPAEPPRGAAKTEVAAMLSERALGPLASLCESAGEAEVEFFVPNTGVAHFRAEGTLLSVRLFDEKFPDLQKVAIVRGKDAVRVVVLREKLLAALERMRVVANIGARVRLSPARLWTESGFLCVAVEGAEAGGGEERLDAEVLGLWDKAVVISKTAQLHVALHYAIEALSALSGVELVSLTLAPAEVEPLLVGAESERGFFSVIMPQRP